MNDLVVDDEKLISTTKASELSGYSKDYVGQLCREEKIDCRRMSGHWYINEGSLKKYQNDGSVTSGTGVDKQDIEKSSKPTHGIKVGNVRDDTFSYDGVEYISTSRAADVTGYSQDYVGQMARNGEVKARKVGRRWFICKEALVEHKKHNDGLLAAVQAQASGVHETEEKVEISVADSSKNTEPNSITEPEPGNIHFNVRYTSETDHPLVPKIENNDSGNDINPSGDIRTIYPNRIENSVPIFERNSRVANTDFELDAVTSRIDSREQKTQKKETVFTPVHVERKRFFPFKILMFVTFVFIASLVYFFGIPEFSYRPNFETLLQGEIIQKLNESFGEILPGASFEYLSE